MDILAEYYETKQRRLELNRQAAALEQREKDIEYELTKALHSGKDFSDGSYKVIFKKKIAANVTSWPALLDHIRTTGQVDLLQKRVTESAVKARWDAGENLPGVESTEKFSITVTKEE
jgi:hypothetical protein